MVTPSRIVFERRLVASNGDAIVLYDSQYTHTVASTCREAIRYTLCAPHFSTLTHLRPPAAAVAGAAGRDRRYSDCFPS
jgi:hypothetical protein